MIAFPQSWSAEILLKPPLIAHAIHHIYPKSIEGDEGAIEGALHLLIKPASGPQFLATFIRGFAEPTLPHGVWPTPHPDWLCAASGGYAYMLNTAQPEICQQIPYRPVIEIRPAPSQQLLLFTSHREILAWRPTAIAWQSKKLSDEGIRITAIGTDHLEAIVWDLHTDKEFPITVDLLTGERIKT